MTPTGEGKSYWDIVEAQFLKNRFAAAALLPLAALALAAIYAPFLASHRPLAFRGYAKKAYVREFREWKIGVQPELERLPLERRRVRDLWTGGTPRLIDAKALLDAADWQRLLAVCQDAADRMDPNRWSRFEVPVAEARELLDPGHRGDFDALIARAAGRVDAVFDDRLGQSLRTVRIKLEFLAGQLEPGRAGGIRRLADEYRGFSLEPDPARDFRMAEVRDRIAAVADPQTFDAGDPPYRGAWHFPVLADLDAINVFFIAASLLVPVVGLRQRRSGLPAEIRWRRLAGRTALAAGAAAAAWWCFVPAWVDTADYAGLRDGRPQEEVVADQVLWTPIRHGLNEKHLDRLWEPPSRDFPLGTDGTGRDVLTRLIWGGRISLSVGFIAVAIYVVLGILVGAAAGYFRGRTDMALSRAIEIVMCIPTFYLILSVLALFGPSMINVMLVIGVTGWTGVARLARGEFLRLGGQDFVTAARALGAPPRRVIFRHILPNAMAPVLVTATFGIPGAILTESALSFLGLGISIPTPSWGGILELVRENFQYWWVVTFAGLAIFITVTCFNLVGEGLRDAMDPRLRK